MAAKLTTANIDACLSALVTALGATSVLHFFTNSPAISSKSVVGDFTEDTSTGITGGHAIASFSGPYTNPLTQLRAVIGAGHTFIVTAAPSGLNLNGWYITDMAGTTLEAAAYLPQPVPITIIGDGITLAPEIDQSAFC